MAWSSACEPVIGVKDVILPGDVRELGACHKGSLCPVRQRFVKPSVALRGSLLPRAELLCSE